MSNCGSHCAAQDIPSPARLSGIYFKGGQIVHKGDLLFVIDPRPYEIKLTQTQAALETANAIRTPQEIGI
jgi:multidrug resistance efflux pump